MHYSYFARAGRGPAGIARENANRADADVCWACACGDIVEPGV